MIDPMNQAGQSNAIRTPPLWFFALTILPYGTATGFVSTTTPFLLSKAGVPVHQVATVGAIAWFPFFLSFLWAPIVDLGWKRRSLIALSGVCTAATLFSALTTLGGSLSVFTILATLSTALSTFSSTATGAIIATLVPKALLGRAGGWYMAGTLAGAALTAGITMWVLEKFGVRAAAVIVAALAGGPSLVALAIDESVVTRVTFRHAAATIRTEIAAAFRSKRTLVAMLCLAAPAGPGAAMNLFSAIAPNIASGQN